MAKRQSDKRVEQWGLCELTLKGPKEGNPFLDVQLRAEFSFGNRTMSVEGFYDGGGVYRIRFSPDMIGQWTYRTVSNVAGLNNITGKVTATAPKGQNHGPVKVWRQTHLAYADGKRYFQFGTTCYAWPHQSPQLVKQTLKTLKTSPFNKIRMCVFPKSYSYNKNEPQLYPYVHVGPMPQEPAKSSKEDWNWDTTRFNPKYFQHFEWCVGELLKLGIEADIILFHPYDRWGFRWLDNKADELYLRYVIARLAAYRNVWWSLANEWDLMKCKTEEDFDRFGRIIQAYDPYKRLCSNHNCHTFYDHTRPWITHVSVQRDTAGVAGWIRQYNKPVIVDESGYEGNIEQGWGNLTPEEMVRKFWDGTIQGGYVGHGETYRHPEDILWWAKGGVLRGKSPARIAFLRKIMEAGPHEPLTTFNYRGNPALCKEGEYYLFYFGPKQPAWRTLELPGGPYKAEVIDTWRMTIKPLKGTFEGKFKLELPGRPYMAARFKRVK